ncbi:MerC domain-containing protein [Paucihalobacter sp.]|uniref:MerC domain-containing protein n=1 Tax=Paucihalobacter sp. TaxID=2850405 RepID=UPI002FE26A5D
MSESKTLIKQKQSDIFGATISGICAIHCTLTPLLFAAKPLLQTTVDAHEHASDFWHALDYVFLILSLLAVWYSSVHTNHKTIKWGLWLAWLIFSLGIISEQLHLENGIWLMYLGSIGLIVTHIKNYRFCKKCKSGI